jgi:hypothetical protein
MKELHEYVKEQVKQFHNDIIYHNGIQFLPVSDVKAHIGFAVRQAQIDAIEATVKRCAEVADIDMFEETPQDRDSVGNDYGEVYAVNKEAILNVANELKIFINK